MTNSDNTCIHYSHLPFCFNGVLPKFIAFPENDSLTSKYEQMFGGPGQLQLYLSRRCFDHSHAAYVLERTVKPAWLTEGDFAWLRSFVSTGRQLGINQEQTIRSMVDEYRQYTTSFESVSLIGLDL